MISAVGAYEILRIHEATTLRLRPRLSNAMFSISLKLPFIFGAICKGQFALQTSRKLSQQSRHLQGLPQSLEIMSGRACDSPAHACLPLAIALPQSHKRWNDVKRQNIDRLSFFICYWPSAWGNCVCGTTAQCLATRSLVRTCKKVQKHDTIGNIESIYSIWFDDFLGIDGNFRNDVHPKFQTSKISSLLHSNRAWSVSSRIGLGSTVSFRFKARFISSNSVAWVAWVAWVADPGIDVQSWWRAPVSFSTRR